MRQRAPYRDEVFDSESFEFFGTIYAVDTLAGASLRFVGWNEAGEVAWDTDAPTSVPATVTITDAAARTYAAVAGPVPADESTTPPTNKVYSWQVQRTAGGEPATLVWGFITVTPSAYANND